MILPRGLLGKWNSISKLGDKEINEIYLQPSEPNWKVNLVGRDLIIHDKKEIETLASMLKKTQVYFPSHPMQVWEVKMILVSVGRDTMEMKITQTSNNGTVIHTSTNEWRKDEVGDYLERITKYKMPTYSDTSTSRFKETIDGNTKVSS